jgi:hypothetical protein
MKSKGIAIKRKNSVILYKAGNLRTLSSYTSNGVGNGTHSFQPLQPRGLNLSLIESFSPKYMN